MSTDFDGKFGSEACCSPIFVTSAVRRANTEESWIQKRTSWRWKHVIIGGETCVYGCGVETKTLSSQKVPETSPRPNKHGKFTLKARRFESVENSQEISLAQLRAFPKNAFCKGSQNWGGGPLGVVYWECKEQLRGGQGRRSARQWNTSFIDNVRKVFGQPLHDVTSKVFIHQSVEAQIEFCSLLCLSRWTPS